MADSEEPIELADAIGAVRRQLVSAQLAGTQLPTGKLLSFSVDKVELEFTGEVKRVGGGGVGVKFWVVSADAKGERSATTSHRVKLTLTPTTVDGQAFKVAGGVSEPPPE